MEEQQIIQTLKNKFNKIPMKQWRDHGFQLFHVKYRSGKIARSKIVSLEKEIKGGN